MKKTVTDGAPLFFFLTSDNFLKNLALQAFKDWDLNGLELVAEIRGEQVVVTLKNRKGVQR